MWGVERDADDVGGFVKARRCSWWVRRVEVEVEVVCGVWCVVCGLAMGRRIRSAHLVPRLTFVAHPTLPSPCPYLSGVECCGHNH